MSNYTVVDTLTKQEFPADTLQDVQEAVYYILDGQELTEWENERLDNFLLDVAEVRSAYSNALGLEVVSHF